MTTPHSHHTAVTTQEVQGGVAVAAPEADYGTEGAYTHTGMHTYTARQRNAHSHAQKQK